MAEKSAGEERGRAALDEAVRDAAFHGTDVGDRQSGSTSRTTLRSEAAKDSGGPLVRVTTKISSLSAAVDVRVVDGARPSVLREPGLLHGSDDADDGERFRIGPLLAAREQTLADRARPGK
jgi:hypothetical protein